VQLPFEEDDRLTADFAGKDPPFCPGVWEYMHVHVWEYMNMHV
jgi:hypothetical protein